MKVRLQVGEDSAVRFYRMDEPARVAQAAGVECELKRGIDVIRAFDKHTKRWDVFAQQFEADVIVIQRPAELTHVEWIPVFQREGIAVVVEIDDDLTCHDPRHPGWRHFEPTRSPNHNWRHLQQCCRMADLVTCSTPALADRFAQHGRSVVLRNCVPAWALDLPAGRSDGRTVGWSGWTVTHPGDLAVTRGGVAAAVHDLYARFHVVGSADGVRQQLNLLREPSATGFIRDDMEAWYRALGELTVGIVPLASTRFNRAKCLDASTRVMTDSGVRYIDEISESNRVWSDQRWRQVEAVSHERPEPGYEIETALGLRLRLTSHHRLMANGEWHMASHLRVGDSLALDGEEWPQGIPYRQAPWPAEARRSRAGFDEDAFKTAESGPRVTLDERWGRLLGLFVGDGSAAGKTAIAYSCDGQDQDLIDAIVDDWREVGLNATTEKVTTYGGKVLRRRSVRVASASLTRCFANLGLLETPKARLTRKRVIAVPDVIWTSPRSVVVQFLAGLFEADGTATSNGVDFCAKDERFARDVQRLLVGFGIWSRCHANLHAATNGDNIKRPYWHVTLRRASADVFAREIGFLSQRKRAKLAEIVAKPHSNAYRPMPTADEIVAIRPFVVVPVDLQVHGGVFAAAGIVSHNSWLKGLEMAARGIPFVASPLPEYELLARQGIGILASDRGRSWKAAVRQALVAAQRGETEGADWLRDQVRARYVYEDRGHLWAEAWQLAMRNRRAALARARVA